MPINVFLHDILIRNIKDLSFASSIFYNFTFLTYFRYFVFLRTKHLLINSYIFYIYFSLKLPVLAAAPDKHNPYIFHDIPFLFFYTPPSFLAISLIHYPYSIYSPLPSLISIIMFTIQNLFIIVNLLIHWILYL